MPHFKTWNAEIWSTIETSGFSLSASDDDHDDTSTLSQTQFMDANKIVIIGGGFDAATSSQDILPIEPARDPAEFDKDGFGLSATNLYVFNFDSDERESSLNTSGIDAPAMDMSGADSVDLIGMSDALSGSSWRSKTTNGPALCLALARIWAG